MYGVAQNTCAYSEERGKGTGIVFGVVCDLTVCCALIFSNILFLKILVAHLVDFISD